jgi:hypothetical protein
MSMQDGPHYERSDTYVRTVPQPVVHDVEGHVVTPIATAPVAAVRTASTRRFALDAILTSIIGLVLLVVGLIAITRGGFDGPMADPVVQVAGFNHTTTLGLIDIGLGACLLISGVTRSRSGALFFGSVLGIAGFVGAVQTESFKEDLALESSMAWLAVVAGLAIVLTTLLVPRVVRHTETIETL